MMHLSIFERKFIEIHKNTLIEFLPYMKQPKFFHKKNLWLNCYGSWNVLKCLAELPCSCLNLL